MTGTVNRTATAASRGVGDNCAGWNVLQNNGEVAGQEVMHVHFHLIPRAEGDGLGYRWHPKELDKGKASELKNAIVSKL